jgi:hypothetical protein
MSPLKHRPALGVNIGRVPGLYKPLTWNNGVSLPRLIPLQVRLNLRPQN